MRSILCWARACAVLASLAEFQPTSQERAASASSGEKESQPLQVLSWEPKAQAQGLAIRTEAHASRVPRSQRGGDIVEPLVREQWFVRMEPLAAPALQVSRAASSLWQYWG